MCNSIDITSFLYAVSDVSDGTHHVRLLPGFTYDICTAAKKDVWKGLGMRLLREHIE
jgi:hypothetical protein